MRSDSPGIDASLSWTERRWCHQFSYLKYMGRPWKILNKMTETCTTTLSHRCIFTTASSTIVPADRSDDVSTGSICYVDKIVPLLASRPYGMVPVRDPGNLCRNNDVSLWILAQLLRSVMCLWSHPKMPRTKHRMPCYCGPRILRKNVYRWWYHPKEDFFLFLGLRTIFTKCTEKGIKKELYLIITSCCGESANASGIAM